MINESEAKYTYAGASSTGWPALPIGVSVPNVVIYSAEKLEGCRGVHIGPGATALTFIPWEISERASDLVNVTIAPLVAE